MNNVDFTDVSTQELSEQLDSLISVVERLNKLHTSTRMEVLAASFPELYAKMSKLEEEISKLFGKNA